jgi:uncharacterized membrane protein
MTGYLILKWLHVLFAIIALGANITYGVWFALAGREPQLLSFALRGVRLLDNRIANPAYGLLLITGMAMVGAGHIPLFSTPWLLTSLILYVILVVVAAAVYTPTLRRGAQALEAGGPGSPEFEAAASRGRTVGIILVIIAVIIVFVMVTKPALWG